MLTMMAVMVLSAVIVQFQINARLHMASSGHRMEDMRCRYAAESGIVTGTKLVRAYISDAREALREAKQAALLAQADGADEEDPNEVADFLDATANMRPSYVVDEWEFQLADVDVKVELHDEGGKLPMLWVLANPIIGDDRYMENALAQLATGLGCDESVLRDCHDYIEKFGRGKSIPEQDIRLQASGKDGKVTQKLKHLTASQQRKAGVTRRQIMAQLASELAAAAKTDADLQPLYDDIPLVEAPLIEFLGIWGGNQVNINTAPVEVLQATFRRFGMSDEIAEQIVTQRQEQPFPSLGNISSIPGVTSDLTTVMTRLGTTVSRAYSVHAIATVGRTTVKMSAGVYWDVSGQITTTGIITGG